MKDSLNYPRVVELNIPNQIVPPNVFGTFLFSRMWLSMTFPEKSPLSFKRRAWIPLSLIGAAFSMQHTEYTVSWYKQALSKL